MEKALQDRLRTALASHLDAAHDRPAVDWGERKAAKAIVLSTVSPGRQYLKDGPDGLAEPRIRAEIFAPTPLTAKTIKNALVAEMETAAVQDGTRFQKSRVAFERDADPEDLPGGTKVFRTMVDFFVPHSAA